MANKPAALCKLESGKLIDTQANFVDTFNWLVAAVNNIEGGTNCQVEWTAPDTPTINCTNDANPLGGGSGGGPSGQYVESLNDLTGQVELVSAADSNIQFTVDGNNIKIGVYYL